MKKLALIIAIFTTTLFNPLVYAETQPTYIEQTKEESITVENVWVRPIQAKANRPTALYMEITNKLSEDDKLVRVLATGISERTEIHQSFMENGIMKMSQIDNLLIPANNKAVEFKPGGLHIMLIDMRIDLALDEEIEVELQFEKSGSKKVKAIVANKEPEKACNCPHHNK